MADDSNKNTCSFCQEGKPKHCEFIGTGLPTMMTSLNSLFGRDDDNITDIDSVTFDSEDNTIMWDNSSGEYAKMGCTIVYCPFCGRKLPDVKEDSDGNG